MKTTVYPKAGPMSYIGDLDLISPSVEYYTNHEDAHVLQQEQKYFCAQLHIPSRVDYYSVSDNRNVHVNRQYGTRFSYHNYTKHPLIIVDRLNLPVTIEPERRYYSGKPGVIIRKELYFDNNQIAQRVYANAQALGTLCGNELVKLMPYLASHETGTYGKNLALEYFIPEADIINADGRLYHLPTDTVVSLNYLEYTVKHPCSPEYVGNLGQYVPNYPTEKDDLSLVFRYVSSDPRAHPKYLRVANKIYKLMPQLENPAKLTAVINKDKVEELIESAEYIECLYPARTDALHPGVLGHRVNRIPLHLAKEKLGIFDTYDEASLPLLSLEKAEQKLRDRIELLEADQRTLVRDHKEKLKDAEATIKAKEAEIDELKQRKYVEQETIKESREKQGHQRKMGFEFIKFLTGTFAALLAIVPLILKFQSTKT